MYTEGAGSSEAATASIVPSGEKGAVRVANPGVDAGDVSERVKVDRAAERVGHRLPSGDQ